MEADLMEIDDVTDSGRGETAEILRPSYLDTSGATAPPRRERARGSVVITQNA